MESRTPREITIMREGGKRLSAILGKLKAAAKPGVRGNQLNELAIQLAESYGGKPSFLGYKGYPAAICLSVNEGVVHGIPKANPLNEGDIVKIDAGLCYEGFHTDSAFTLVVGQNTLPPLLQACYEALLAGTRAVRAGVQVDSISSAIEHKVKEKGFTILRAFGGHGVGKALHEEPIITNFVSDSKVRLPEASTVALEPIVGEGGEETRTLDDGWTVVTKDGSCVAHFEHTILVKKDGAEVLTPLDEVVDR